MLGRSSRRRSLRVVGWWEEEEADLEEKEREGAEARERKDVKREMRDSAPEKHPNEISFRFGCEKVKGRRYSPKLPPMPCSSAPSTHSRTSRPISEARALIVAVFPTPEGPERARILCRNTTQHAHQYWVRKERSWSPLTLYLSSFEGGAPSVESFTGGKASFNQSWTSLTFFL